MSDHNRGTSVLTARKHPPRRDVRVSEQIERHEPVIGRRFRVVENRPQLGQVRRPQEVGDVVERRAGHEPEHIRVNHTQLASVHRGGGYPVGRELPVLGLVRSKLEQWLIVKVGHDHCFATLLIWSWVSTPVPEDGLSV